MRLGKAHLSCIENVAHLAMSGECSIVIPAPNPHVARRIFQAATPHMEERGAQAIGGMTWKFSNGSNVKIEVDTAA